MSDSICTTCGYRGYPKTATRGSLLMEIALWFLFIIPGILYTLWRNVSKYKACPKCKNPSMIPTDSPFGKKLVG